MKDVLIGVLTGIAAVVAATLLTPKPQPPNLPVRELAPIDDDRFGRLGHEFLPNSDPEPVRASLEKTRASMKVASAPLESVVNRLAEVSGQNIYVDWVALDDSRIGPREEVTLDLQNVPVAVLLRAALKEAGRGKRPLDYCIIDGVVRISTADDLHQYVVTRVYNVRDLIEQDVARGAKSSKAGHTPAEAAERLTHVIQEAVDPNSWRDAGGSSGMIRELGGRLIITQTPSNQDAVLGLLSALRRSTQTPNLRKTPM
jgi:hypothetical protein